MTAYHYERLSPMDYSFLASETSTTPMHVAGLEIFEAGPLATPHGGIDIGRIRDAYLGVLHRMPRYRQRLMWIPVEDRPVWVDDPDFDLDDHLLHVRLPQPGGEAELKRVASRLIARHLDRRRPLWEAWVVEGLDRDRFAILAKTHHCMIDGLAGVEIAQLMLSPSPDDRPAPARPWRARPAPTPRELFRDEALRRATLPLRALRSFQTLRSEVDDVGAELATRYRAMQDFVDASTSASSPTPINGPLGPHRRFDWLSMRLADVKAIGRALGCTVNDVFLATATHAFRELLLACEVAVAEIVFRASTPVSLREEDDQGEAGNRVASWFVTLPVGEPDRLAQVEAIRAETERLKRSDQAQGMEIAMAATELLPAPLLSFAASFASSAVNTIVTNVPGPQHPLYLQGARLEALVPSVPLLQNIGLGIALMSYNGRVFWGLAADHDLVDDLPGFAQRVDASFEGLAKAAGVDIGSDDAARLEPAGPGKVR